MTPQELKKRTQTFALRIFRLVEELPKTYAGKAIAMQLVRSGTSIGANYRAACRGRSKAEFRAKLGTVVEEADESVYWLELIIDGRATGKIESRVTSHRSQRTVRHHGRFAQIVRITHNVPL